MRASGLKMSEIRHKVIEETEGWGSLPADAPAFVALSNGDPPGMRTQSPLPGEGKVSSVTFPDGTLVRLQNSSASDIIRLLELYRLSRERASAEGGRDV